MQAAAGGEYLDSMINDHTVYNIVPKLGTAFPYNALNRQSQYIIYSRLSFLPIDFGQTY